MFGTIRYVINFISVLICLALARLHVHFFCEKKTKL